MPTEVDAATQAFPATVQFKAQKGRLSATVRARGAQPNSVWAVKLMQPSVLPEEPDDPVIGDCHTIDGYLRTDNKGNGKVTLSEPLTGDRAQLSLSVPNQNYYRARETFTIRR